MQKVKQLNEKNGKTAIECMQKDIPFNLKTKRGYLFYVGGILSKLHEGKQYIYSQEKKRWEEIEW